MSPAERTAVVILGPTGAGKSALALELAKTCGGEIVTADSRQIYAGMNIGTEKPGRRASGVGKNDEPILVEGISHYLVDILAPDQRYSAAAFREDAQQLITDIHRRGNLPIVVGGAGFYIRVLTGGRSLPNVPPDPVFRAWAEQQPLEILTRELQMTAPNRYARVDNPKNKRRVMRALEIARGKQETVGSIHTAASPPAYSLPPPAFRFLKIALVLPTDLLRARLAARVEEQFRRGFPWEVRRLVSQYGEHAPGLQAVGYRQMLPYLRGDASLEKAKRAVLRAHWQYARRQLTWLKKEPSLVRVASAAEARHAVADFLPKKDSRRHHDDHV